MMKYKKYTQKIHCSVHKKLRYSVHKKLHCSVHKKLHCSVHKKLHCSVHSSVKICVILHNRGVFSATLFYTCIIS